MFTFFQFFSRRFSLTARVSMLLVLAVVVPLIITVVGSLLILRPTLLSQAEVQMQNDAESHAQVIDSLLIARLEDIDALGQFFAIQKFLAGDELYQKQALEELSVGAHLDPNYSNWALFDLHSNLRLAYPTNVGPDGKYMIAPEVLPNLQGVNKSFISDVHFDNNTHMAFVYIYASITSSNGQLLGYGRATLQLNDIWTEVNNETNAASGSYAMILDGNGVRIAYTNPDTTLTTLPQGLFKSVDPISAALQQRMQDENLYGNNSNMPVSFLPDPTLAQMLHNPQGPATFELTPALQQQSFQAYRASSQIVPWTYVVLRPMSTITGAADQQERYLISIAFIATLLAAFVGLLLGGSLTRPILSSVRSLSGSSQKLKSLASSEQVTATEQKWIVESSQTVLKSVQYYAEATEIAARRLDNVGQELVQNWGRFSAQQAIQRLEDIISVASYIEKASSHQEQSSRNLATAIRIATQVTDQLLAGATSAADAAKQLEDVIEKLRQVVGK